MNSLLNEGEASAINFCLNNKNCVLIIDDGKGRMLAKKLGLKFTGTLGLIVKAKQKGIIETVRPYLDHLEQVEFRFSEKLKQIILTAAGE